MAEKIKTFENYNSNITSLKYLLDFKVDSMINLQ